MKVAVILCLLTISLARLVPPVKIHSAYKVSPVKATQDETILILEGVLQGLALDSDITEIQDCVTNSQAILNDFSEAVQLFKQKTPEASLKFLKEIEEALHSLPNTLSNCGFSDRDIPRTFHVLNIFRNPLTFSFDEKAFIINGVDLAWDLASAVKFYDAQKWRLFGFYIGASLNKVSGTGIMVIA